MCLSVVEVSVVARLSAGESSGALFIQPDWRRLVRTLLRRNAERHRQNHRTPHTVRLVRAVLTNGHTGHVPRAPGFFFFLSGPQLAVVK